MKQRRGSIAAVCCSTKGKASNLCSTGKESVAIVELPAAERLEACHTLAPRKAIGSATCTHLHLAVSKGIAVYAQTDAYDMAGYTPYSIDMSHYLTPCTVGVTCTQAASAASTTVPSGVRMGMLQTK